VVLNSCPFHRPWFEHLTVHSKRRKIIKFPVTEILSTSLTSPLLGANILVSIFIPSDTLKVYRPSFTLVQKRNTLCLLKGEQHKQYWQNAFCYERYYVNKLNYFLSACSRSNLKILNTRDFSFSQLCISDLYSSEKFTQRILVIVYRRFGTSHRSHLQWLSIWNK
jgi:hypothetical protein